MTAARVDDPRFVKVAAGPRFVTHVALLRGEDDMRALAGHLRAAHAHAG